uniref:Uncharacterized protein n=1 Tax=Rhizophagus irregularis (strain DAOM 181602 / DAOM 197198 / MUCL 43194) TaxID=747089 RepID=U9USU6_RHIID
MFLSLIPIQRVAFISPTIISLTIISPTDVSPTGKWIQIDEMMSVKCLSVK